MPHGTHHANNNELDIATHSTLDDRGGPVNRTGPMRVWVDYQRGDRSTRNGCRTTKGGSLSRSRYLGFFAVLLIVSLFVAACSDSPDGGTDNADGGNQEQNCDEPVVVGISLSQTGNFAEQGKAQRLGYELWRDVYNEEHDGILCRPIELKIVDDASNPDTAVSNYQSLITKDEADLLFAPFSTLLTAPAVRVAARYGYVFPAAADGGPDTVDQQLPNFFLIKPTGPLDTGRPLIRWLETLPEEDRPKTAAYAAIDDPFLTPATEKTRLAIEELGIETVYDEVYPSENYQMLPIVAAMKDADPDLVVGGTHYADSFDMINTMVQQELDPPFVFQMTGSSDAKLFPENVGPENAEGVLGALGWYPEADTFGNEEFTSAWLEEHGGALEEISNEPAETFAVGQMIAQVIEEIGTFDNQAIIEAMRSKPWPSMQGTIEWDEVGLPKGSDHLSQWVDGVLRIIYPEEVQTGEAVYPKPPWGS